MSNKNVERCLHINPKTLEQHRFLIMAKLSKDCIVKLTEYATQKGLAAPEP